MKKTATASSTNKISNIWSGKYLSTTQLPSNILYNDSKYYRKDKKLFSLKSTGRTVNPIPGNRPSN